MFPELESNVVLELHNVDMKRWLSLLRKALMCIPRNTHSPGTSSKDQSSQLDGLANFT
jgi:hypothetical protein